jgi:Cu2+-containing amine oxidase
VSERLARTTEKSIMKTIAKFIFGLAMFALACGSIAFAQVPLPPVPPADSAAKAAALGPPGGAPVTETVAFKSKSRWHLTLNTVKGFGLVITGASFQKSPTAPFIYVLFDGRLGEIFVPYHSGDDRFTDLKYGFSCLKLTPEKFPPPLQLIGGDKICKEVRDYLAYMDFLNTPHRVRYGQEAVYFSVLDAANYQYIMEWTFRDDGVILVRAGSTGPKFPGHPNLGHIHDFTWRLDIDLNGAGGDSAFLTSHYEDLTAVPPARTATDGRDLVDVEGGLVWNDRNFNTLLIQDSMLKNGNGRPTSYELVPMRSGTARHLEDFTKKDFWVTRYNPTQSFFADELPDYVRDRQSTVNQDLVVWYTGSEHHENNSRDEDKNTVEVLWTGFELVPNNLFDHTPFYP